MSNQDYECAKCGFSPSKRDPNLPPMYVMLNDTALRLQKNQQTHIDEYVRDAGMWEVRFRKDHGKLVSVSTHKDLNGVELKECSYEKWKEDNGIDDEED